MVLSVPAPPSPPPASAAPSPPPASAAPSPPPEDGTSAAVRRVLELARARLGMDVAWLSVLSDTAQTFVHVDAGLASSGPASSGPAVTGPAAGSSAALVGSYCTRVLDGRLPAVVPDARADPRTRDLPVTQELAIGAYAGAPVRAPDGQVVGMLCCTSTTARPHLSERDRGVLELLAGLLGELQAPAGPDLSVEQAAVRAAVTGQGRTVVLQPIVDLRTGRSAGAEALSRFSAEPFAPDRWFARADRAGLRVPLELAAARDALDLLTVTGAPDYVSINLSPDAITSGSLPGLLELHDPSRIVVEITEHAAVTDYQALRAALAAARAAGLRLAVDDAGAGYASLRHIVQLQPDLIKVDISLVRDIDTDLVKQALTRSLALFAHATGAELVAEGVQTQAEYDKVAQLGVTFVQGHLLAAPGQRSPDGRYPRPSPHLRLPSRPLGTAERTARREQHQAQRQATRALTTHSTAARARNATALHALQRLIDQTAPLPAPPGHP